jgi:Methyltransferase FkbM domain
VGVGSRELCILAAKLKNVTRIIAIEPDQAMVKSLQANIDHNEILYNDILSGRIEIIEKFIGAQNSDKYITLDQLNIDHSLHGFIKIDVDGSEFDVLRSGQQLLSYTNVDILVETRSYELERNCVNFLENLGYTCRIIKPVWWRSLIPEQRPREHNRWLFATPQLWRQPLLTTYYYQLCFLVCEDNRKNARGFWVRLWESSSTVLFSGLNNWAATTIRAEPTAWHYFSDLAEVRTLARGKEALDEIESGAVLGREGEFESRPADWRSKLRFLGNVRGTIVEDQLDRGVG